MEPTEALRLIETRLRELVSSLAGDDWLALPGAPDPRKLESRKRSEASKRPHAAISARLLDYTMTGELSALIRSNWSTFETTLGDRAKFVTLFGIAEDVRNTIAHNRDLLPYERDLLSGAAGFIADLVATYRKSVNGADYPKIERAMDNFGHDLLYGDPPSGGLYISPMRYPEKLAIGDPVTLRLGTTAVRGVGIIWKFYAFDSSFLAQSNFATPVAQLEGEEVEYTHVIREEDVSSDFTFQARLSTTSRYHAMDGFDDQVLASWYVVPPHGV